MVRHHKHRTVLRQRRLPCTEHLVNWKPMLPFAYPVRERGWGVLQECCAIDSSCFWPPERPTPFSRIGALQPWGKRHHKLMDAGFWPPTSSCVAHGLMRIFLHGVGEKLERPVTTTLMEARRSSDVPHVYAADTTLPASTSQNLSRRLVSVLLLDPTRLMSAVIVCLGP